MLYTSISIYKKLARLFKIAYKDRSYENGTPTNKYYRNQGTLNGDKTP